MSSVTSSNSLKTPLRLNDTKTSGLFSVSRLLNSSDEQKAGPEEDLAEDIRGKS